MNAQQFNQDRYVICRPGGTCERGFYNAAAEGRVFHVMDRPQANKLFIYFVPFLNHHNSCCLFHAYNTQLVSKSGKLRRSSNSQFID